jgi:hypothetical protein
MAAHPLIIPVPPDHALGPSGGTRTSAPGLSATSRTRKPALRNRRADHVPVAKSLGLYRQPSGGELSLTAEVGAAPEHYRYGDLY